MKLPTAINNLCLNAATQTTLEANVMDGFPGAASGSGASSAVERTRDSTAVPRGCHTGGLGVEFCRFFLRSSEQNDPVLI